MSKRYLDSKRHLQRVLRYVQSRGETAFIHGNDVVVLVPSERRLRDGTRHVDYRTHRIRTVAEARNLVSPIQRLVAGFAMRRQVLA